MTTVDILLAARDILGEADELGGGVGAMKCAVIETAPCVEAAVVGAYERATGAKYRFEDGLDTAFDYLLEGGNYGDRDTEAVLLSCAQALLSTAPMRRLHVWMISDDLHSDHGPVEGKRIAVDWLDKAATWAKEEADRE